MKQKQFETKFFLRAEHLGPFEKLAQEQGVEMHIMKIDEIEVVVPKKRAPRVTPTQEQKDAACEYRIEHPEVSMRVIAEKTGWPASMAALQRCLKKAGLTNTVE